MYSQGSIQRQRGAALLVSLMMLLLLTVLAVSAVNMTTLGLKGAANMQDQQLAESTAQAYIDYKLSESPPTWIRNQEAVNSTDDSSTDYNDVEPVVYISRPVCLGAITAPGYEERYMEEINRFDNAWRVDAEVKSDESVAGESVNISQGVVLKAEVKRCTD